MFTVICFCTSYYMLLGYTPSWEVCHEYLLYIICYDIVAILVDLNEQNWMNISFFELFVLCIETRILVPIFSIYHIFTSIIRVFCRLLLLGNIFNLNIQHSKTCNQHHLYTIFEQIPSFSCFIFSHTRLQRVILITRKGVLSSICKVKRMYTLV